MEKEKAVNILESLINGYLYNFLTHALPDAESNKQREQTIGSIKFAYYIGIINKEKFEYYINRIYLEENEPLKE